MKNLHKGHRSRLRETAAKNGIDALQEHQALELLLTYVIPQKDVNPLAHTLINKFGSFSAVLDAKKESLMLVRGVGEKTAHFLSTFKEFFFLYKKNKQDVKTFIKNTQDAVAFVGQVLNDKLNEELYIVCIDGMNSVKRFEQISKGSGNQTNANIRKITEIVLESNTHNIIICHNHPAGDCSPSSADNRLTKALVIGLSLNNINVLDHIIIGQNGYYSYNLSGKIFEYQQDVKQLLSADSFMQNACSYNEK